MRLAAGRYGVRGIRSISPKRARTSGCPSGFPDPGSGLIDHIQKITVAAMQIADMKVWAHRS